MSFADEIAAHDAAQGGGKSFADEIAEHEAGQGHDYAKIAGNVGAASGALAPYAAALSEGGLAGLGSSAIPITAGLAGSALAGAGTKALLDATNATPTLEKGAAYLRSGIKEPQHQSVGLNMAQNMFNEVTDPRAGLANLLTAAPDLASAYVSSKAGPMAAELPGILKRFAVGNKVPQGQDASAFINTLADQFGTKKVPDAEMNMGQVKQALRGGRSQLGAEKGAVEGYGVKNAATPEDGPALVQQAIEQALQRQGVRPGKAALASSESAANALQDVAQNKAPLVENAQDILDLQRQLAAKGAAARKPTSPTSDEAPYFEGAAQNLKAQANKLMPEIIQGPLAESNKAFSAFSDLQKMGIKSGSKSGWDSSKAVAQWNAMEPAQKIQKYGPEVTQAFDTLFKQDGAGLLDRVLGAGKQASNFHFGSALDALVHPPTPPVRFNAPISPALSAPVQSALRYGGSASQAARRLSQVGAQ